MVLAILMLCYLEGRFCLHDYKKIDFFVIPSEIDMIKELGYTPKTNHNTTRIYVTDMKCSKCNKHKRLQIKTKN